MYELQSVQFREPQAVQNFVTRIVECHLIHFKPCDTIHCLNPQNLFIGRNDLISTKSLLFIRKMTILKLNKKYQCLASVPQQLEVNNLLIICLGCNMLEYRDQVFPFVECLPHP
jgi:hypothetical protein